ncbi:MAG: zinc metallopeptidase [Pseudomonadaceae bacterium]|nr:zinc metallopeptidase [Pseudomonadaceae bacterium]
MVDWRGRRRSTNVEDARGQRASRGSRMGGKGIKLGGGLSGIGIVAVIVVVLMGGDPSMILNMLMGGGAGQVSMPQSGPAQVPSGTGGDDDAAAFMSVILADTETTWNRIFQAAGQSYPEPKLRLFTDAVNSSCGYNTAATGPFYCPPDQRVFLDLGFFNELTKLGAPGDFAQAYVIGHEIGHHVQNVTGVLNAVQGRKQRVSKVDANALQVLVELQADCYAGIWAHYAENERDLLEAGDIQEGLQAAASIGDDRLQKRAGRQVQPESFTHGSSAQRMEWFKRGFDTGDVGRCDTFADAGVRL